MPLIFSKFRKNVEKSRREEQEFRPGKKDVAICKKCDAVYFHKSWHHKLEDYKQLSEEKAVNFLLCPACKMLEDNKFEGQVIIENVPEEYKDDVSANIKNTGERAYKRDPMDRVSSIKYSPYGGSPSGRQVSSDKSKYNIEVLTTENQLARNIARQIEKAFKGTKTDVRWSKEESVARIVVRFKI